MSWGGGSEVFMVSEGDRETGVKSSHSLGEKAVEQSDRASFDTPVPSTWWQELEEVVGGVGGVLHDAVGFAGASCKENIQDGGERGTDDLCGSVHCPL